NAKRPNGNESENQSIKKYFKKTCKNTIESTTMPTNDSNLSNHPLASISNTESIIVLQNISNQNEAAVEPCTKTTDNEHISLNNDNDNEQTNEPTSATSNTNSLQMISLTTTTNTIDDNQYPSDVDQIGVKLRLIEKLFDSCQDLIKQSTSIDIAIETFTKNSNDFADTLMKAGDDLKCLCTKIISILESNRNQITITDGKEVRFIYLRLGYYESDHHFTEEQLRYLVLAGPYQIRHHNFPKDKSLKAAKTTLKERLLSLQELASKVGEDICRLLFDTLSRKGISTDKIIGQCYDNAPNMSGIHKGVQACINKHLNREIMHTPCEAHTSNLVVEHSCKCSTEFVNLFMLLEEVYNLFSSSVKRYYVLRGALEKSTFGLTVKSLSDTRWNANYESLHCVVESYNEIIDCLELIESIESKDFDKETKAQAKNIKNKLIS
ncbi:unnamed protein product, partial [Rotaria magnacalcarata]